ncbi:MAG: hypothetical protein K0R17_1003 [Rariglobus sp.]|jgi:prepilin-type N-terminal cleavage/methylation domain-containing protein|nr:hypothetical protein [Rariglobus sp.]
MQIGINYNLAGFTLGQSHGRTRKGFTLIELLTVIAIIGILAGIIIPTVGSVKISANKAKSKTQFTQWAASTELFKQEYGYYPRLSSAAGSGLIDPTNFFANLTARSYNGTALTGGALVDNKRKLSFYSVSDSELAKDGSGAPMNLIVDAFGNSAIMVMLDANGDGVIKDGERRTDKLAGGNISDPSSESSALTSGSVDSADIRSGVAFYSAGRNNTITDYVYSWK